MNLYIAALLVTLGLVGHVLGKLLELQRADPTLTLKKYLTDHKYQSAFSAVSAVAGAIALYSYGELTAVTAVATGYMADSIMDKVSSRTASALK